MVLGTTPYLGQSVTAASNDGDFLEVVDPAGVEWGAGWMPTEGGAVMLGAMTWQINSVFECADILDAEFGAIHGHVTATLVHVNSPTDGAMAQLAATF